MRPVLAFCWLALCAPAKPAYSETLSDPTTYFGMCDASAAVSMTTNLSIVANDEDNVLRVYRRHPGGLPVLTIDLNAFLRVAGKSTEKDSKAPPGSGAAISGSTSP